MTIVRGRPTSIGWKRKKLGDKFQVVIELDEAPGWPIDVVWKATPIYLSLEPPAIVGQVKDGE
jgi:hypothetical protein